MKGGWYTNQRPAVQLYLRKTLTILLKVPQPVLSVCPVLGLIEAGADTDTVMESGAALPSLSYFQI